MSLIRAVWVWIRTRCMTKSTYPAPAVVLQPSHHCSQLPGTSVLLSFHHTQKEDLGINDFSERALFLTHGEAAT